jgi:hypothetical protein
MGIWPPLPDLRGGRSVMAKVESNGSAIHALMLCPTRDKDMVAFSICDASLNQG